MHSYTQPNKAVILLWLLGLFFHLVLACVTGTGQTDQTLKPETSAPCSVG